MISQIDGFRAAAVHSGIKESGDLDLGLIVADNLCNAAATFTTNKLVSPAVVVSREHIKSGIAQAVYVNAGNANTCTGTRGLRDAQAICREVARCASVQAKDVLACSTGVIGHYLPMPKVRDGIKLAAGILSGSKKAGTDLARAIMTTDTKPKTAWREITLGRKKVRLAGIAKGSGMIAPNMATMLAFITTDAVITPALLRRALKKAVSVTFNKVTIDNHMSTSDTAIVLASGAADNASINKVSSAYERFAEALWGICDDLAQQMAADGEGATCAVTVKLTGAATQTDATRALRAIVDSPLVRTAFYGADPNWGRIISAIGYSGARFDADLTVCKIAGTTVFRNGRPSRFDPSRLSKKMKARQWLLEVDLGIGTHSDFCYTCDLTHDYITINAEYHT